MSVWTIPPNWSGQVRERLEWLTDVLVSFNETETRYVMRIWPRRSMEFSVLVTEDELAILDGLVWEGQANKFDFPIWTDGQTLTSPITATDTTINVQTDYYDFEDGQKALIYVSPTQYELVDIDTVAPGVLNLLNPVVGDWPVGVEILPVRQARLNQDIQVSKQTTHVMTAVIRFEIDPSDYPANPSPTIYDSIEVFEKPNNWINPVTGNYLRKTQRLDYRTGDVFVDDVAETSAIVRSYRTLLSSREEISDWRGWGYARQGRAEPFWMNQDQYAFTVESDIGDTDTTISINDIDAETSYLLEQGRVDIAIQTNDGTWFYRRITDIQDGPFDTEIITIDSPLGVNVTTSQIALSTWLMLSRLDGDVMQITWHSKAVAEATVNIRSIKA